MILISNNLGDAKSLITHPRTTTHARFTEDVRLEAGIRPACCGSRLASKTLTT